MIGAELDASKKYYLTDDGNGCVEISLENVAKAEAMIYHSSYGKAEDPQNEKSAQHWIKELGKYYNGDKTHDFAEIIKNIVGKRKRFLLLL